MRRNLNCLNWRLFRIFLEEKKKVKSGANFSNFEKGAKFEKSEGREKKGVIRGQLLKVEKKGLIRGQLFELVEGARNLKSRRAKF